MALITCPECGRQTISDRATACPDCAYPIATVKHESLRTSPPKRHRYIWIKERLWVYLILYLIFFSGVMSVIPSSPVPHYESSAAKTIMLFIVSVCMFTERGEWKTWERFGFVGLAWIVQAIFSVPSYLFVQRVMLIGWDPGSQAEFAEFIACFPIIVYAMRRSRLFVKVIPD